MLNTKSIKKNSHNFLLEKEKDNDYNNKNVFQKETFGSSDKIVIIENKGIEISAKYNGRINKNLSYFVGGNITFNKNVARVTVQRIQIFAISGVSQCIQINNRLIELRQPIQYKIRANKARAACYQNH